MSASTELLSIVVPAYNEQEVLNEFHNRLSGVVNNLDFHIEIIYVNDGSTDDTLSLLSDLHESDERVAIIDLSRNFGKEIALTAGLHKAAGDAVVVIDADLQDPPELIPEFIKEWKNGYDVVYAKRTVRHGESILKKATANGFYRVMQWLGSVRLPEDTGDFRLLNRKALNALNTLDEKNRFMKGLFAWIGFRQKAVLYKRDPRHAGTSKWNYWKLWNFALDGITSFTTAPLKISTYLGLFTALGAFLYGIFIIFQTLIFGSEVPGYPSLVVIILFIGGIQLTAIGVLGEYLGRVFGEIKNRPLYFVNEYLPSKQHNDASKNQVD